MKSRIGKIARLPLAIRNELNTRLSEGDPAPLLIEWLNTDPAVLAILNVQFDGQLISEADVSRWRRGGYMEWALVRECAATARGLSESTEDIAATGISAEHLLTVITAHYAKILHEFQTAPLDALDELDRRLNLLRKLTNAALALRRREFQAARLELDRSRHELAREKQLSKSPSTGSSSAFSSPESASSSKNGAPSNSVDPINLVLNPSAKPESLPVRNAHVSPIIAMPPALPITLGEVFSDFASTKIWPTALSGPISAAPAHRVAELLNASLSKTSFLNNLV